MFIIKRDGSKELFSTDKISSAILSAGKSINPQAEISDYTSTINKIVSACEKLNQNEISINVVVDIVERELMKSKFKEEARSYILYRSERDRVREMNGTLYQSINSLLNLSDSDIANENANKDAKIISTHRDLITGLVSKDMALKHILPEELSTAHKDGYIHIHDLDYLITKCITNCCLVNYPDMLDNGFKIGNASIESPKSIGVACTILSQISLGVASSQYGGQTMAHIDKHLSKYVEMSHTKLKQKQEQYNLPDDYIDSELNKIVYDACQTLLYQWSTLTSCNGQTPFITISLGLDTSYYGRLITKNYLEVHMKGLGKDGLTPVFPKVIFFLQDGVNLKEGDPNYDLKLLAMECSAKRIYPDYISVPNNLKITGSSSTAVTSMGCRSFLSKWEDTNGEEKYNGRFNLGVVSANLPMYAREATSEKEFYILLDKYLELMYDAHMIRVNRLKESTASQNPVMFMEGVLARLKPNDKIEKIIYDGYASISIGYVGLPETSELIKGSLDKEFMLSVLNHIKEKCNEFTKRSGLAFSLYGTPAENLAYRFATKINEKYPNTLENDFITNSFHYPVWLETDPISKFEFEEGFANISSGGNISYVETPNLSSNLKALEDIIDYGYEHMHYFGINQPVDRCFECGYEGEFTATATGFECPECHNHDDKTMSVTRRVSGYLGNPTSRGFNHGKQQEVTKRIKHM